MYTNVSTINRYQFQSLSTLQETWTIYTLDLADNNIGVQGASYIAELLQENEFIKHLVLYSEKHDLNVYRVLHLNTLYIQFHQMY